MKKLAFLFLIISMTVFNANAGKIYTSYRNALFLAYSQANSVYEDDNIKLEIYNQSLWATNKTSKTIYIDLAQCFSYHNGSSTPMFQPSIDVKNKNGDKKASKSGISTKDDLFIVLAPNMGINQTETHICRLSSHIFGYYSTTGTPSETFTDYDRRLFNVIKKLLDGAKTNPKAKKYDGSCAIHLTEDESINNIGASIAYAFNKNTEEWTTVSLSTWVCDVIFAPYYLGKTKEPTQGKKKGFDIKETGPIRIHVKANTPFEFEEDKAPIIGCEWIGNYKEGTFNLKEIWVPNEDNISARDVYYTIPSQTYKCVFKFDGTDSDWGKMKYASWADETEQYELTNDLYDYKISKE